MESPFSAFPFSAIVLIGMSGIGKTTNAEKYGEKTTWADARQKMRESGIFLYISADDEIANRLADPIVLAESEGENVADDLHQQPVDRLANFVGKFGAEKHGGLAREEFFKRQGLYRNAEQDDLEALPALLDSAYGKEPPLLQPLLYDTTGSFCEVLKNRSHPLYRALTKYARIVYLECSKKEEEVLLQRQVERPKPMVYDEIFFEEWLQNYKKKDCREQESMEQESMEQESMEQESVEQESMEEEDIEPDDFLRFVFPKAIAYRRARYEDLADVVVSTTELKDLPQGSSSSVFAKAFITLVKEKLSSPRPSHKIS